MINKIFLFEMEWKTVLIIFGLVVLAIVLVYFLLSHHRLKKGTKKAGNQLSIKYSTGSNKVQGLLNEIKKSSKYNGTYKSLSGRAKKKIKKFMYDWFDDVAFYALLTYKTKRERTPYMHLCLCESFESPKYLDQWVYIGSKSKGNNFKKLIKMIDKHKVCFGTFEVITQIFDFEKDHLKDKTKKIDDSEYPSTSENNLFIRYIASTKKVIK